VLTNSPIQIPVSISLLARSAKRLASSLPKTPTNAAYVALPDFYTMRGTVGNPNNPKKDIDKVALLKIAAKGITGAFSGGSLTGGKTNSILQGLTGILSGSKPARVMPRRMPAPINRPPTSLPQQLVDDLLKPRKQ